MSTVIVTGTPPTGSSLESDLQSLGFDVERAADDSAAATQAATVPLNERVALVDARFVGHRHSLRLALTDPRFPAAAVPGVLTAQPRARHALARALAAEVGPVVATGGGVSGGSPARPGGPPASRPSETREAAPAAAGQQAAEPATLPGRLAERLAAEAQPVHRPALGPLVATVPEDPDGRREALAEVAAVDEERVRLDSAVKARDGFFTTFFVSPYSRYVARWCARRGLTPNHVTLASLLTALVAAGCAATGTRSGFVAAAVLLIGSFVLDCADGQLARYTLQYSTLGAWLDATFDRVKEYAFYAGLALGAGYGPGGADGVWALALAAMVLQTCRHVVDFSFAEGTRDTAPGSGAGAAAALSNRLDGVGWTVWLRRMIVLPIGERWALIAVLTAATRPVVVFWVLLAASALAACYTTAGRVLRSPAGHAPRTDRAARALADLADSGPLAEAGGAAVRYLGLRVPSPAAPVLALTGGTVLVLTAALAPLRGPWLPAAALCYVLASALATARLLRGPLDWLVPPLFRVAEYSLVLVVAARSEVNGTLPAAFGLVAAVAYHHYDTVYRIRGGSTAPPRLLVRVVGGHEGRVLVVALAAAALTGTGLTTALAASAVALGLTVLAESIRFWVSATAPAVHDETGEPA